MRYSTLAACAGLSLAAAARADITFSDSVFPDANWPTIQMTGTGSASSMQIPTGGNPAEARQITTSVAAGFPSSVFAFHQFGNTTGTIYTPSSQGAITSIIASMDYLAISGQQGLGFAIKQANVFYMAAPVTATDVVAYHTDLATLTAANFVRIDGQPGNPNFVNGQSMRFGIFSFLSTAQDGNGFTTVANVDNWSMHLVPAPGSLALLGLGAAALRRRR
jgi:hypothetical protein